MLIVAHRSVSVRSRIPGWLRRLFLVACWHALVSTVPGSKGRADRPARQPEEGSSVPEATVSFAGNLTADPEVRYTRAAFKVTTRSGVLHVMTR